jgi:hypothetical protein
VISKDSFNKFRPQIGLPVVTCLAAFFIATFDNRTPAAFKVFLPECSIDNVQDCSQQEIVNAYDNTIAILITFSQR